MNRGNNNNTAHNKYVKVESTNESLENGIQFEREMRSPAGNSNTIL